MTTSPPAVSVSTTEVCRITVEGPAGRADLALPLFTPLAALLPALLRHVSSDPDRRPGAPWVLQRLGEEPLDLDGSPDSLGLRHGDLLYLRPADEPLPGLHFDDVSDGVAHVIGDAPDRWRPALTRGLGLSLAALNMLALAATVFGAGPGALTASACAAICLVLAAGCVAASGRGADAGSVRTTGVGALVFAALTGLVYFQDGHGRFAPGLDGVLLAAGAVALLAAVLLPLKVLPFAVTGTFLFLAVVAAVVVALTRIAHLSALHAVAMAGVAVFVLGHFAPRLMLRAARLRVPQLPRTAEELQQGIDPESEESLTRRVGVANAYLNTLSVGSAIVYAVTFPVLVHDKDWTGWTLPLVFSFAVLLRARNLTGALQRIPMTAVGTFGLAVVLVFRLAPLGATGRCVTLGVLLGAVGALLIAAWRLPTGRLLPVWGHLGDIVETLAAVALLPLLLQSIHAYAYFRYLAS